eukprot:Pompholyxophrys_sp_v1_NODE_176_length_1340_cov_4.702955.p1 type:complete len:143 gc:universal NODE_176_length_1340_cov_4.702955:717-289(-)
MEIRFEDVTRFTLEMNMISFIRHQLVFIDEFSTDNRSMLRKWGWFLCGKSPQFKSCFRRDIRLSFLCFLSISGIFEAFQTFGTFDRTLFFDCCRRLLQSGKVHRFPGPRSVWILDGASIHVDPALVNYMWSIGIILIYLPSY